MKTLIQSVIILGIVLIGVTACKKDVKTTPQNSSQNKDNITEKPINTEWNKNKTIQIDFISQLANSSMSMPYANNCVDYISNSKSSVFIIERTDVNYNVNNQNTYIPTFIGYKTNNHYAFGVNKYNGDVLEGNTILINHKLNGEHSYKITPDCYIKTLPVRLQSITQNNVFLSVPLGSVRLENKEQIVNAINTIKTLATKEKSHLIVGTIKKECFNDLQNSLPKDINASLVQDTKQNDYSIFVLGYKTWVLRQVDKHNLNTNLNVYTLFVEANVY